LITETFLWETPDHLILHAEEWKPELESRACIVLVHGLGEHIGRYRHVAEYFTRAGFAMIAFDLRGHGRSQGQRGHAPSYKVLTDDIQHFVEESQKRHPQKPCFLYGHSLGGSLVLYYLLTRQSSLAGAIVTSPGLLPARPVAAAKRFLVELLVNILPTLALSNDLDVDGISRDRHIVDAYRKDPLVHDRISARLGMELLQQGEWILSQIPRLSTPLLLMQGSQDRLVDAQATQRFAANLNGSITWKQWEGFYHEIHNEPEKHLVLDFMLDWLSKYLEQQPAPQTELDPGRLYS
jgi:alpha-beta hydrolase superfamily lysophospholipase